MLKVALCDDDAVFLEEFRQVLEKAFADAGQPVAITSFSSGIALIESVEKRKEIFDVVFLDVEMPTVNGFQVAQRLRCLQPTFVLIFITYQEHQSREGYLYGAFRYVFKNHLAAEAREAVESLLKKQNVLADHQQSILFKCRNFGVLEDITVQKQDILFLKREKSRRVILKTIFTEYELLTKPLSSYAKLLAPPDFQPVLRNYIVNFNQVQSLGPDCFILTGKVTVPMGINRDIQKTLRDKYLRFLKERI